ncbi:MAG TPA: acyltransferase, partial [Naasia sp.]
MGTAIPTTHPSSGGISGRVKRRDIQGLRALAVALVVVYHCAPQLLPGGYVGVDVFLVISGYLITAHLANEFYATGRVSLTRFYARRARRLLPAALLVLAVTVVASALLLPESSRAEVARQVVASAFYFENWVLAFNATDYSAASANSSPVQHYWSLSVEEQFYALWPLAILGAGALAARLSRSASVGLGALLSVVASVSLLASALVTAYDPNFAYFFTPIRLWEFAVGGLAWFLFSARTWSAPTANALSWIGLGLIAAATLSYDEGTPFPGLAAVLPVLGAALVLAGGETTGRVSTA